MNTLFAYDRSLPLNLRTSATVRVHDIQYRSPLGGDVPAFLVTPVGPGRFAGVLLLHGAPGSRNDMLAEAIELAQAGAVALAITAPFARNGVPERPFGPYAFTEQDRDGPIQLVVDLQRGIDLLLERGDVDPARLAFVGVSYGGASGVLFAGVEPRLRAAALVVADGGPIHHFDTPGEGNPLNDLDPAARDHWLAAMQPVEGLSVIGNAAPTALLFQWGLHDEVIGQQHAQELLAAASEPKEALWYESGHWLPPAARSDRHAWLARQIGIAPPAIDEA